MINLAKLYNTYYATLSEPSINPIIPEYTKMTPSEYTEKFFKKEIQDMGKKEIQDMGKIEDIYENEEQQNILLGVVENNKIGILDNNQINELRSVLLFDDIKAEAKNETIQEIYEDLIEEENKLMEQPIPPSKVEEIITQFKNINIDPTKIEKYLIQNMPADLILKITIIFLLSLGLSSLVIISLLDFIIIPKIISK